MDTLQKTLSRLSPFSKEKNPSFQDENETDSEVEVKIPEVQMKEPTTGHAPDVDKAGNDNVHYGAGVGRTNASKQRSKSSTTGNKKQPKAKRTVSYAGPSNHGRDPEKDLGRAKGKKGSSKKDILYTCEYCEEEGITYMIECEACERWSCLACHHVTLDMYHFFTDDRNRAHWFCRDCEAIAIEAAKAKISNKIATKNLCNNVESEVNEAIGKILKNAQETMKEMVNEGVKQLKNSYADVCREPVINANTEGEMYKSRITILQRPKAKGKASNTNKNSDNSNDEGEMDPGFEVGNVVSMTTMEELVDRERRKSNVVFYNVPESQHDQLHDRVAEDKKAVLDIAKNGLKIHNAQVVKAIRLGSKRQDKMSKPRALLIQLESPHRKSEFLSASKRLRQTDRWKDTYISPDMTRQQREENWKLRQELKQRRENGEQELVIRQGKIVTRWKKNLPTKGNGTRDKREPREANPETNLQENADTPDPAPLKPCYIDEDNSIEVDGVFGAVGGSPKSQ